MTTRTAVTGLAALLGVGGPGERPLARAIVGLVLIGPAPAVLATGRYGEPTT